MSNGPFDSTPVSAGYQKERDAKIRNVAFRTLNQHKRNLRKLRRSKRALIRQLRKSKPSGKTEIVNLISQVDGKIAKIAKEYKGYVAEIISTNRDSLVSLRIVNKLGYKTVDDFFKGEGYTNPFASNYSLGAEIDHGHSFKLDGYAYNGRAEFITDHKQVRVASLKDLRLLNGYGKLAIAADAMAKETGQSGRGRRR